MTLCHKKKKNNVSLHTNCSENTKLIMEKVIDENKQGSSLNLASKPENTKKLYLESYVC